MHKPNYSSRIDRSPKGVGDRNGLSVGTIYKEIRCGRLIAKKVGVRTIVPEKEESDWLNRLPDSRS